MTVNQKVWLISIIILLVCLLLALVVYINTGNIIIAILIAPPIIHWMLNKRLKNRE